MKYSVQELLNALKIEENPNASSDFAILIILLILFIIVSITVKNFSKIKTFIVDKKLYNFIIEFKNISLEEKKILDRIAERNKIKRKYEILILEGLYDKYTEREIVNIKMGFITEEEKVKEIMKFSTLREKLFGNSEKERVDWE